MAEDIKLTKLATCAGCGAKVGAGVLASLLEDIKVHNDPNLLVGFERSDDASVYKISDELALVQTVDFFPPIVDDPYTFGAIAATNALSDVYAMGGEPKLCLNIMAVPANMPKEAVHDMLRGGYDKVYEAGALITGGHSIIDPEPKYGLAVTGFVNPEKMLTNCGAKQGDVLFLTKPLGIGILTTAIKGGILEEDAEPCGNEKSTWFDNESGEDKSDMNVINYMRKLMMTLNKSAAELIDEFRNRYGVNSIHACTDVTGFGLLGHALEMALGSDIQISIDTKNIDILPSAYELAQIGILPEGMYRNRDFAEEYVSYNGDGEVSLAMQDILYDPQTSGGLLIAVDKEYAEEFWKELNKKKYEIPSPQRIGVAETYGGEYRIFLH